MKEQLIKSTSSEFPPYVEFKDLPDTTTPVDATNLNALQSLMRQDIQDNQSIPTGGVTGQVLGKASNTDYDVSWVTIYNKQMIVDLVHPVGSYYETSDTSFNPSTAWGGTWVEDTEGLSTIAYKASDNDFSTVGATVGEKEHMITLNESYWNIRGQNPNAPQGGLGGWLLQTSYTEHVTDTHEPISLIQPSIIVKRWHRIA